MGRIYNVVASATEGFQLPAVIENALPGILSFLWDIILTVVILIVGAKLIKFVIGILAKALDKGKVEQGVATFLCSLAKYALYFVLVLVVLSQFGVTAGSVIAVLGSAGLTVGLALQGSLSNFAGGVLILLLKPFVVGDYIIETSNNHEGTVSEITIFYTKLLTVDNKMILIPNGVLSNTSLINASAMDKRRVDIVVGVSYDSDIAKVKRILADIIENDEARLVDEDMNVFVSELADSSVNMGVRLWVKSENYWSTKWRITEKIKYSLDENGISIPFPQMDVNIRQ